MRDRQVDARVGLRTVAFDIQSPTVSVTVAAGTALEESSTRSYRCDRKLQTVRASDVTA